MAGKRLTIFTPTYNRKELLKRVYNSLLMQNSEDFIWLIVDDGSTDDTESMVSSFISEGKIEIKYIYRENGGKMRAHNQGARECDTELFLCLDSDDWLNKDAVKKLLNAYDAGKKEGIAGVIAHKGKSETELLSSVEFPQNISESTLYNLYLNGFKGETTIMFVTEVIKQFPFPEIDGEKYVPEDYIYDKIDKEYKYVILPEIITVCELMENGYTDSVKALKHNNKKAFYLYYEQRANITPFSVLKIKYAGFCVKYAGLTNTKVADIKLSKMMIAIGMVAALFIRE